MSTVTKKKLIMEISQKRGIHPNDVRSVIQSFLDSIIDSLSDGDRLEFRDFGVFEVVQRKQKIGRNPKKPSVPIVIPSRSAVKFTPGRKMKENIENQVHLEKEAPSSGVPSHAASEQATEASRQL